jgi:hypothetical protein
LALCPCVSVAALQHHPNFRFFWFPSQFRFQRAESQKINTAIFQTFIRAVSRPTCSPRRRRASPVPWLRPVAALPVLFPWCFSFRLFVRSGRAPPRGFSFQCRGCIVSVGHRQPSWPDALPFAVPARLLQSSLFPYSAFIYFCRRGPIPARRRPPSWLFWAVGPLRPSASDSPPRFYFSFPNQ